VSSAWIATALSAAIILVPLTLSYLRQWTAMPIVGTSRAMVAEQTLLPAAVISAVVISNISDVRFSASGMAAIYATGSGLIFAGSISFGRLRDLHWAALKLASDVSREEIFSMLYRGLPLVAVSIGAVASQSTLPMAIAVGCGFENAACFALAIPYATLPAVPLGVLGLSLIPQCARLYASGEILQANHRVRSAATLTFWSAFVIAGGILLVSPQLTQILGPQYQNVVEVMPVLLLAVLIDCLTGPTVPVMQTMGLQGFYAKAFFGHWPLQIILVIALGRTWGLMGASAGYLVSRAIWNLLIVIQIHRYPGLLMLPYLNPFQALAADQNSLMPGLGVSAKARAA
jgi:O-antigen/teichoic acid export membrane protein